MIKASGKWLGFKWTIEALGRVVMVNGEAGDALMLYLGESGLRAWSPELGSAWCGFERSERWLAPALSQLAVDGLITDLKLKSSMEPTAVLDDPGTTFDIHGNEIPVNLSEVVY